MDDLAHGMDAGIGAPGTSDDDGFTGEREDRLFEGGLDGVAVLLALPADIGRAIIFDGHAEARHQAITVPLGSGVPRRKSSALSALPPAFCCRACSSRPSTCRNME